MCIHYVLVISFPNVFEMIIFDLKYILDLIYCIEGFTKMATKLALGFCQHYWQVKGQYSM